MLAVLSGFSICFILGWKKAEVHDAMPILMLGIGVDDMFVICNAVDQTKMTLPPAQRIKQAMRHAGPSISITSLTNALAFLAGSVSSIIAVQSFCIFCAVTITMLYLSVLTVFLPIVYWDTLRVSMRKPECCGAFCCHPKSILFCKGKLASEPQKAFD